MNQLYASIIKEQNAQIFYVTNSSQGKSQKKFVEAFEKNYGFQGQLFARESKNKKTFKIETISSIIEANNPDLVILIGDNAGTDPVFYSKIAAKYPTVKFLTYIRIIYKTKSDDSKLREGQTNFFTAGELSADLASKGMILNESSEKVIESVLGQIDLCENKKPTSCKLEMVFPKYANCRELTWQWAPLESSLPKLEQIKEFVSKRCKN